MYLSLNPATSRRLSATGIRNLPLNVAERRWLGLPTARQWHAPVSTHKMEKLTTTKLEKLEDQKNFAKQLHSVLNREVAVSQRPGFFEYYQPSDDVKRIYETGECSNIVHKIVRTQQEIDCVDRELSDRARMKASNNSLIPPTTITNLDQWFSSYGRPKDAPAGAFSSFHDVSRIYGATGHHRAFKSQAMTMRKGRLTN